jgi:hypothetical protein
MASGDSVVKIIRQSPPATSFATLDTRTGGSTPAEAFPVLDFDGTAIEYMDYLCRLEKYAGGGLTFTIVWSATSATTGDVRWEIGIRRLQDDVEDIDTSQTYDYNGVTDTTASATGEASYCTITFTDGVDMDSWADGEAAVVRLRRDPTNGADTIATDVECWGLFGKET